ncbi:hypothetical protein FUT69_09245 [Xylella taiwanensis]|uniref:Uncharacterized protein n=1 Tax=Xylella taiwanensis TaxID=1444770 RepID=Z9JN36_9GAMM|nr:hypothetical protein [Xylella taiwanensis]AXI83249.1 hypothetical protein AB672_04510 [Xylella taiwanensis]EWS79216.1 hypothetical protein AF72_01935 [Xylella taiwanensis]MCD8456312.1 hypothetical protein [Xylella taiwanensis]MCD8458720.1 hypothetical protein [Xylella taiwanensis]MCD8460855.1 hypothetical protein [Xylella taiwanensis]
MPFINEIPTAEDIEKYGLPFKKDLNLHIELRRQWTVDRERNFHLYEGGPTANQAFKNVFYYRFYLYLNGSKFIIKLDIDRTRKPSLFKDNPYVIEWNKVASIKVMPHDQINPLKTLPPSAWENPDVLQPLLDNYSFNQFIAIFKAAVTVHGAGRSNRHIHTPIVVRFRF